MNGPGASFGGVVHRRMFSIVKLCAAMSTTKKFNQHLNSACSYMLCYLATGQSRFSFIACHNPIGCTIARVRWGEGRDYAR